MPISWNEIKHRAIAFSNEWKDESREHAEAKSFWDDFFHVFGLRRRVVASFEEPVKKLKGSYGFIDLFWKGILLAEHKSRGKDLSSAHSQAMAYIQDLQNEGRDSEIPRYILVSDFGRLALYDLEDDETLEFPLADFHKHVHAFAFIPGFKQHAFEDQDPVNLKAVERMAHLHDTLEAGGYVGHPLERFLVRILFCLFADHTGLFDRNIFRLMLEQTRADGADLGPLLARIFDILNKPLDQRQHNLDENLATLPFVNGGLFEENLPFADFNGRMREAMLLCAHFDWSQISPAIFGSLFQAVMEPGERRKIGGHYTSERDILKVIRSLFLDDLRAEFERIRKNKSEIARFHKKLGALRFLDPACGCGNFLVITYRELRLLEIEVLKALHGKNHRVLDIHQLTALDVDALYGIEIQEWPVRIAEVALWLMDHQMNLRLSEAFGQYFHRLPLSKSPTIVHANALEIDWKEVLAPERCSYILGNPPFVGKQFRTPEQNEDMKRVAGAVKGFGLLDYVTAWYFKAAVFIRGTRIAVGFVSTNSISQGEQVGVLWNELFARYHLKIHFAHRTFAWESEARGKAHVHVVIVGFAEFDAPHKRIYDYESEGEKTTEIIAKNISPYLIKGSDIVVTARTRPLCHVPEIVFGNMPNDGGHLILDDKEKKELVREEPEAARFIRRYLGAEELFNNGSRWCLWLVDASPAELRAMPTIKKRIEGVRQHRLKSPRATTRALAQTPMLFGEIRQPRGSYLLIPSVSSERRQYIPMAFMPAKVIGSNLVLFVPEARLYHFAVLSSSMHMAWVKQVCGRLKSDYRYSNKLVYNNFPWPDEPGTKRRTAVERAAQGVLDVRKEFADSTLADLYDPLSMPRKLLKAHAHLDRLVDLCFRSKPFASDRHRVEFLFNLYEKLATPLLSRGRKKPPGQYRLLEPLWELQPMPTDPLFDNFQS